MIDRISDDVYLIAWIPPDTTIARNIVMGQRKGKDTEPVDIFKDFEIDYTGDDKDETPGDQGMSPGIMRDEQ